VAATVGADAVAEVVVETETALIASIEAFDIDGGPVQTSFADRLAEEQGWTPDFTQRVIREYKRFVALAMISKTPVTPSLAVDEAWHLHLIYTRSYWERFMPMLPRPLHHEPTKGGEAEDTKHKDQFGSTLVLYRQTFGEDAPADIWLGGPTRETSKPTRASLKQFAAGSGLLLAGCTTVAQINQPDFVMVFLGIVILFVGVWVMTVVATIFGALLAGTTGKKGGSRPSSGFTNDSSYTSSDSSSPAYHHGSDTHSGSHCGGSAHCSSSHDSSSSSCSATSSSSCSSSSSSCSSSS
jgi:hypothetical protein